MAGQGRPVGTGHCPAVKSLGHGLMGVWEKGQWAIGRVGKGVVESCWCSQGTGTLSHTHHIVLRCYKNSSSKHAQVVWFSLLSHDI